MKNKSIFQTFCIMLLLCISIVLHAQVPKQFNYQGVARDAKGNPLCRQTLSLKLSVLPTSDANQVEYEETQIVSTNEFGLYTLQIGNGTVLTGDMKTVKWESGNKYIKVAIDPQGGNNFHDMGTTQLLSVPYAIYSDMAGIAKESKNENKTRATNNYIEKTSGAGVANSTSLLYDNGTNIGLGTTSPSAKFHIYQNVASVLEHLRMQNVNANGAGRFTMYNDGASAYATFTKYGSTYAGGYAGISTLYPYANLLAFGNNGVAAGDGQGRFLISSAGNIGMSIFKGGTSKLKFHTDFVTENVGIGGNAVPESRVHLNNTDGANMDIRLSNTTSGHTATDGFKLSENGPNAELWNYENGALAFGTNNNERMRIAANGRVGIGTNSPNSAYRLTVNPDPANLIGGVIINDAGDETSLKISKTGLNPAVEISKTSTTTATPSLNVSSVSTSAPAQTISSGNTGLEISATKMGLYSQSDKSYGVYGKSDSLSGGYFTSNGSTSDLYNGVLRGEYTGTSSLASITGVYGKSVHSTTLNDGIGVRGEGGYKGIEGIVNNPIPATVYGLDATVYNNSSAYGVYGQAGNNSNSGVGTKYGIYGTASGGATNYAAYFSSGNVNVVNMLSKGGGTFKIDHPLDPENKILYHSFVESPDMMNIYNGNITTDANGEAIVHMPDYFNALNSDFRYQLTTIGSFAQVMVSEKINGNTFKIKSNTPNVEVSWMVTGVRKDAFANQHRVQVEVEKNADEKGKYIHPTAFGLPESQGIDFAHEEVKRLKDAEGRPTLPKQLPQPSPSTERK